VGVNISAGELSVVGIFDYCCWTEQQAQLSHRQTALDRIAVPKILGVIPIASQDLVHFLSAFGTLAFTVSEM